MKTPFLIFISLVCFSSCKKIYTCECNTTYTKKLSNGSFFTEVIPGSKTPYTEKLSNSQATAACDHEGIATETNFRNAITADNTYPLEPGESVSTSCFIH